LGKSHPKAGDRPTVVLVPGQLLASSKHPVDVLVGVSVGVGAGASSPCTVATHTAVSSSTREPTRMVRRPICIFSLLQPTLQVQRNRGFSPSVAEPNDARREQGQRAASRWTARNAKNPICGPPQSQRRHNTVDSAHFGLKPEAVKMDTTCRIGICCAIEQ
jgi:hypothetical protein